MIFFILHRTGGRPSLTATENMNVCVTRTDMGCAPSENMSHDRDIVEKAESFMLHGLL